MKQELPGTQLTFQLVCRKYLECNGHCKCHLSAILPVIVALKQC